uniref:Uncharacterized protein n=1 Tax=Neobodo designis TaxID=312471 RepID=A0A6U4SCK5_NEODS|mmetsp:Transcript_30505/g.94230  ORF Transcript_30505/g.94230 Transcript_30505/m.94230 type:complete len:197 (+) Transcript_30505:57-647(+)
MPAASGNKRKPTTSKNPKAAAAKRTPARAKPSPAKRMPEKKKVAKAPAMSGPVDAPPVDVPCDDPTEEEENAAAEAYLEQRRAACVEGFVALIDAMNQIGATQVILTNHPSYDLSLGACAHDGNGKLASVQAGDGTGPGCLWADKTVPFFTDCWRAAGGVEASVKAILLENGIGTMNDLDTGAPPEPGVVTLEEFA